MGAADDHIRDRLTADRDINGKSSSRDLDVMPKGISAGVVQEVVMSDPASG